MKSIYDILEGWSDKVKPKWHPKEGLFTSDNPQEIADYLIKHSEDKQQAMQRLVFYMNRAGDKLTNKEVLNKVKKILSESLLDPDFMDEGNNLENDVICKYLLDLARGTEYDGVLGMWWGEMTKYTTEKIVEKIDKLIEKSFEKDKRPLKKFGKQDIEELTGKNKGIVYIEPRQFDAISICVLFPVPVSGSQVPYWKGTRFIFAVNKERRDYDVKPLRLLGSPTQVMQYTRLFPTSNHVAIVPAEGLQDLEKYVYRNGPRRKREKTKFV